MTSMTPAYHSHLESFEFIAIYDMNLDSYKWTSLTIQHKLI